MTALIRDVVDLTKHFEGLHLKAYLCPAGVPTIGFGHTKGVVLGDAITEAEADRLLAEDLDDAAADVDRLVRVKLTPGELGALASFVFNLGPGNLQVSTLLALLNAGDHAGAVGEFGKWVKASVNGRKETLPGLVKRRAAEALLFQGLDWRAAIDAAVPHPMPQRLAAPQGSEDDRVCMIQRIVGAKVDGVYGPATRAAVRAWQAAHGLVDDGIVGPRTAFAMGLDQHVTA